MIAKVLVNNGDQSLSYFHAWAGPALGDAKIALSLQDLQSQRNSIIFCHPAEANHDLDLAKALAKHNYFAFVNIGEVDTGNMADLVNDAPEFSHCPFILGGENQTFWHINLESFYFLTLTDTNRVLGESYTIKGIFNQPGKPWHFRYLNGQDRHHRNLLYKEISSRGVLDQALCSYLGYHTDPEHRCDIPLRILPDNYETPYRDHGSLPYASGDERSRFNFTWNYWRTQPVPMQLHVSQFTDSYFTVEAEMSVQHFFPTEKTFKPILAGHPFVILGPCGFYQRLHQLGFRTFDHIIDESFDHEPDLHTRIKMIADQVQLLCESDLDAFLNAVKDICIYNQQHYINNHWSRFQQKHHELANFLHNIQHRAAKYLGEAA